MVYESSYDSGRKPFRPDVTRGYWAAPGDFIYAGLGLGLRLDVISVSWVFFAESGVYAIIPYVIFLALYVVPLVVIQTFMGQFSSSGFISSLRISPIFKSMGYIATALNLTTLMYYSVMAAVPLLFLFNSLRPTLPWSCEAFAKWGQNLTEEPISHICNLTEVEYEKELDEHGNDTAYHTIAYHVPSVIYFDSRFGDPFMISDGEMEPFYMSWEMVLCTLLTWAIIAGICYKFFNTEKLGKLIRYGIWITVGLLALLIIRVSFLHTSKIGYLNYFKPGWFNFANGLANIPIYVLSGFGPGWGSMISIASFNKFKTNIMSYSWFICLGQMGIFLGFDLLTSLLANHMSEIIPKYDDNENYFAYVQHNWVLFLSSGSIWAGLEWANMWCILFFFMLATAAVVLMVTQLYALLTSLFDEFATLREHRTKVTFTIIGFLALCSLYCCSNHGVTSFSSLPMDVIFTQTGLNLLLLLVVLWIYGRERFQRDIEFMLGRRFSTWRVNMLRFFSPLCLLGSLMITLTVAIYDHYFISWVVILIGLIFILLPWLLVPIYAIVIMLQTTGSLKMRFQRCCRPSDWYPVEAEDRQRYEEAMGNMDITHQLNEVTEDVSVAL